MTTSIRERVYAHLRRDLMAGALDPSTRLGEERLARMYGVSRTPVREALIRLLADGLVHRTDTGFYPYRPRLDDLAGLYELRLTLEVHGISRIVGSLDDAHRRGLANAHDRRILEPMIERWRNLRQAPPDPDRRFVAEDERFHVTLLAASGSPVLAEALEAVNARIRPVRMVDHPTERQISAAIDEHIRIGDAVLDGDLLGARSALTDHIDQCQQAVLTRTNRAIAMAKFARSVRD